jgi:hypothetical protein
LTLSAFVSMLWSMTRAWFVIAMLVVTGCAGSFGSERSRRTIRALNVTTLVASTAMLAMDACQTHSAAAEGWSDGRSEGGNSRVIMGSHPGEGTVVAYFAGVAIANVAVWYLMPERWRSVVPGAIIGIQVPVVIGNMSSTSGCGGAREAGQ